jgi:hypothetical protein
MSTCSVRLRAASAVASLVPALGVISGCAAPTATPSADVEKKTPELAALRSAGVISAEKEGVTVVRLEADWRDRPDVLSRGEGCATASVLVDGRPFDPGVVDYGMDPLVTRTDGLTSFRTAVVFLRPLPPAARDITVWGTVPIEFGEDPTEMTIACPPDPTGIELRANGARCVVTDVYRDSSGRYIHFTCHGGMSLTRIGCVDSRGASIPSRWTFGSGSGISVVRLDATLWLAADTEIAGFRVTTYGRAETRDVPFEVRDTIATEWTTAPGSTGR